MKKFSLHWQILAAFALAIPFGIFFKDQVPYVSWMGGIFIKALKMLIIPLIFTSIVSGITNIGNAENLGRLGIKTIAYYITTSLLALLTGLFFVNLFQPGIGADLGFVQEVKGLNTSSSFSDILTNIIPENIISAMAQGSMLSIIFFALLIGLFITKISNKHKTTLSNFFNAGFEVMMKITMFIIKLTPLGIFGIITQQISETNNLSELFTRLGSYMLVVIIALSFHAFISLPLILKIIGKAHPFKHFKAMRTALLTAFSTSSSSATLPITMSSVEKNAGVSNTISSFTLPLGATINMDGTALYELVAAMFIAQAYGIELTFTEQLIGVLTGLLASIGAAGIPMAGLVMISVVLSAMGIPLEGIGLILAVDRILDMFRTSVNVWSDSCGAVVVAKSEGEKLEV